MANDLNNYIEEKFDDKATDQEILDTVRLWLNNAKTYHDELLKKQKEAEQYYLGNQTQMADVPAHLSDTVENRIFEAVETLAPIATANAHQFQVLPGGGAFMMPDPQSVTRAGNLQKVLSRKYDILFVQQKLEDVTRHMMLYRFGVLKYCWDSDRDDIDVKVVDPRLIFVPRLRVDPHDLPYVIEVQSYSKKEIEQEFAVKADQLVRRQQSVDTGAKRDEAKDYQVLEVWTNEMVAWVQPGTKVLRREQNPYYDFEGEEKKVYVKTKSGMKKKSETRYYNHLDNPEKPYIFFGTFNISEGPLPTVSLVEVGMPMQDAINAQKRSIINNLKQMGNGQVYVDDDALTQEQADNMTNEPGLVLRGRGLASENKIRREPGVSLPNMHFSNLQHSEVVFDNILGVHSATRGAAQAKTLGQDIISRQQDFTRLDMITRVLNRGVFRLANGLVQLMKLYYTEDHVVKMIGETGAAEFITLNRTNIDDHIEIEVKSGVNLPMDEVSLRNEAVQLWQLGAIDPVTLFERLKFSDPQRAAQRLLGWKTGQLDLETNARIKEAEAGVQAKAGAEMAAAPTQEGQGRKTESIMDVLARARKELGVGVGSPKTVKKASTKK